MTYHIKDTELSEEEFAELKQCVGEFRRICRDQVYYYVKGEYFKSNNSISNHRLKIAENLLSFLNEIEYKNKNSK